MTRKELEEAINAATMGWQGSINGDVSVNIPRTAYLHLREAARTLLETLPKTKTIHVRRWVSFDLEEGFGGDGHLILNMKAFQDSQADARRPGQWVTFEIEVPA